MAQRRYLGSIVVALCLFLWACGGSSGSGSHDGPGASSSESGDKRSGRHGLPLAVQIGHAGDVYIAAFSPDGSLVATGDRTGAIEIWDPLTGEVHAQLEGHTANVTCFSFSRDGKRLASGGEDGRAFVWDLTRGARVSVVEVPDRKVWAVALSPEGDMLAVRDNIGLSVHRADSGQEQGTFDRSTSPGALLTPDGAAVVLGLGPNLQIMEILSGKIRAEMQLEQVPRQVIMSNDGHWLVTAGGDSHKVSIFNAATGDKTREVAAGGRVVAVALDAKATIVAAAVENTGVEVFDVKTGAPISTISAKHTNEWHFGLSADGKQVFASDSLGDIHRFDTRTGKSTGETRTTRMRRFILDPVQNRVAILGDVDPSVDIWDGTRMKGRLEGAREHIRYAGFFADGKSLAVVEEDSPDVVVFDLAKAGVRTTIHTEMSRIYEAIPSPDGAHLFLTGYGESEIVDAKTGKMEKRLSADRWSSQHEAAWSKTGELAFVGLDDHTLYRFGPRLDPMPSIELGTPAPTSLAYSPDGTTLAAAGRQGVVLIRNGQKTALDTTLGEPAYGIGWSPDAARLAIASERMFFTLAVLEGKATSDGPSVPAGFRTNLDTAHSFVASAFSPDGTLVVGAERGGVLDFFAMEHLDKSFHTHGTPWSVSFLPGAQKPVVLVAAQSLGLVRVADGATVRLRTFLIGDKRVGIAMGLGGVAGDPEALARVRMRSSADMRSKVVPVDPSAIRPGLALEVGR